MQIRRIDIENFRGIRHLCWKIPPGRTFLALIGPGDSTKTTILTALDFALGDRWSLSLNDTDFFGCDIQVPIDIRVTLTDLSDKLLRNDAVGMNLCGINVDGELFEDPDEDHEHCLVVRLTVDGTLEPVWTAYRVGKEPEAPISAATRRLIGAYKVDERINAHLRWSRTSALGRLTQTEAGADQVLLDANRQARVAVDGSIPPTLSELTERVRAELAGLGSGDFHDLKPGLDLSIASATGNLALYEGNVPLTGYGLGSRRLAGVATQKLAQSGSAFLFVDEVEYGLEPHRLINLLTHLQTPAAYSQVFATTHSPTALRHLDAKNLAIVRSSGDGEVTVVSLGDPDDLQAVLRSCPEAFLARQVLFCEGKTELGIALEVLERTDSARRGSGKPVSAALGLVPLEAGSGSQAVSKAEQLRAAGYEVIAFMDSDVENDRTKADDLSVKEHATVIRWDGTAHTEAAFCGVLNATELSTLINLATAIADDPLSAPHNYLQQLKVIDSRIPSIEVATWGAVGISLQDAQRMIGHAAHKHSWFKRVDRGRALYKAVAAAAAIDGSDVHQKIATLIAAIYRDPVITPAEPQLEDRRE